jgi:uncharacterized protein (TIGR02265 family)
MKHVAGPKMTGDARVGAAVERQASDAYLEHVERIQHAPESGVVRGLYFLDLLRAAPHIAAPRKRYIAFSNYPMREFMQMVVNAARAAHPAAAPQEAIRRLGFGVYDVFANSLSGSALLSVAQRDFIRVLDLAPRGYELSVEPCKVTIEAEGHNGRALVQLRELWTFPEAYHVGLWQGMLAALGIEGTVTHEVLSPSAVDLQIKWIPVRTRR